MRTYDNVHPHNKLYYSYSMSMYRPEMDQPGRTFSYSFLPATFDLFVCPFAGPPPPHKYYVWPTNCGAPLIHTTDYIDLKLTI